jgi:hypothetical protein
MTIFSVRKYGAIAATVASLSILASVAAQSATAADFKASGKFSDTVNFFGGDLDVLNLEGGTFDGIYSATGLPSGSDPVVVSNWLFNLRDRSGTVLRQFSDSFGDGAGFSSSPAKDSLAFGNDYGYILLDFAPGFTGIGAIQVNSSGETGMSSKTVGETVIFDDDGSFYNALTELDIVSGSSEAIPTPALLPGLMGMGVAAFRKRRGEVQPAAD